MSVELSIRNGSVVVYLGSGGLADRTIILKDDYYRHMIGPLLFIQFKCALRIMYCAMCIAHCA